MGNLGLPEILIIAFLLLIFFGARRIPELAKGIGKGIREFRKAIGGDDNEGVSRGNRTDSQEKKRQGRDHV